jgi:hypothetical protein
MKQEVGRNRKSALEKVDVVSLDSSNWVGGVLNAYEKSLKVIAS